MHVPSFDDALRFAGKRFNKCQDLLGGLHLLTQACMPCHLVGLTGILACRAMLRLSTNP